MAPTSDEVVRALTAKLAEVTARLEALEADSARPRQSPGNDTRRVDGDADPALSRRQLLTKLGAAAGVGVAGALVLDSTPAAAAGSFQFDAINNATGETILNTTGDVNSALQINENGASSGNRYGLDALSVNGLAGVHGVKGSTSGLAIPAAGVVGDANQGAGVVGATSFGNSAGVAGFGAGGSRGGVYGTVGNAAALVERAGVVGTSDTNHGVAGVTTHNTRAGARGVWSTPAANTDVPAGVLGTSTNRTGVYGASTSAEGVVGVSNSGIGVSGTSVDGPGVLAVSANFAAIFASGRTHLDLAPAVTVAPVPGAYSRGEVFLGKNADLMLCKTTGNPATFVRVGYNALPLPFRLFDSRVTGPAFGPNERRAFTISGTGTAPNDIPAGDVAHAAQLNVTIVNGTTTSYLTVMPHDAPGGVPPFSSINWTPGQVLANQNTVRIVGGKFDIYNSSGNVHVIVDVLGFFS